MKTETSQNTRNQEKKTDVWIKLFPLIFILGVLPLSVHLKIVETGLETSVWFPAQSKSADFFAWWRSRAFAAAAVWMAVVLVYRTWIQKKRWKLEKNWGFLASYLFFVFISTVFSEYKEISWNGMVENYEGCVILLLYGFSFFYAAQVIENNRERKVLFVALAVGAFPQALIGISQLAGNDFWGSPLGNSLIAPGQSLSFRFAGSMENPVYMALYNPNYAAVFILLVLPVCFYLISCAKKKWQKWILGVEIVLLLCCLWGTGSRAGLFTGIILLCVKILAKTVYKKRKKWPIITGILILSGLGIWMVYEKTGNISYKLQDIQITENGIELTSSSGKCTVNVKEYGKDGSLLFAKNDKGEKLFVEKESRTGRYVIQEKTFQDFSFETSKRDNELFLILYYKKEPFTFVKKDNQEFTYENRFGKTDTIEKCTALISDRYDQLLGSRVYIWNRLLPLLKNYIVKGSGPDTFAMVFPQNDYVGRVNAAKVMYEQVITKPHDLYLQTALQTGVLSLLCLLGFLGSSLKKLLKKESGIWKTLTFCIAGYLIMGLVNDSMIVTAPVFWVLLGTGAGVDYEYGEELQNRK